MQGLGFRACRVQGVEGFTGLIGFIWFRGCRHRFGLRFSDFGFRAFGEGLRVLLRLRAWLQHPRLLGCFKCYRVVGVMMLQGLGSSSWVVWVFGDLG